jgi:NADH-quinone oxidoreductase subunit I
MRLGDTEQDYYVEAPRLARKWGYPDPVKGEVK